MIAFSTTIANGSKERWKKKIDYIRKEDLGAKDFGLRDGLP